MHDQEILVDVSPGETRVAILTDGRLDEVLIERDNEPSLVGAVVLAPVTMVRRDLGAVFVDLGKSDGYLDRFSGPPPNQGESVIVQVVAEAHRSKAARVSADPTLQGDLLDLLPTQPDHAVARAITAKGERRRLRETVDGVVPDDVGLLIHAQAKGCEAQALEAEATDLMARWSEIQAGARAGKGERRFRILDPAPGPFSRARRIAPDARVTEGRDGILFGERDIDEAIARATERRTVLPGGTALVIEETEALVAIDVDTGGSRGALENPEAFAREVAAGLARQIRLRRLAGLIVIDFPRTASADARRALTTGLEQAMAGDADPLTVHGWTRSGLLELTRPRRAPSLHESLRDAGAAAPLNVTTLALEALRRVARESSGIARPKLVCPNPVRLALQGQLRPALNELERRLGTPLALEVGPDNTEIDITGG
jgi:ribonuclease G